MLPDPLSSDSAVRSAWVRNKVPTTSRGFSVIDLCEVRLVIPALPDVQSLRANGNLQDAWDRLEVALPTISPDDTLEYANLCASVFAWYLVVWLCEPLPEDARTYALWVRYHYAQTRSRPDE